MIRSFAIAAAVAGVLAGGALSVAAGNGHGSAVSKVATSTMLSAEARGDAVSAVARTNGNSVSTLAKAQATDKSGETDTSAAPKTDASTTDNDAHGDAVSLVAKSDATAAHANGAKSVNHGGAVSAAAQKH